MIIRRVEVVGLFGKRGSLAADFQPDLNITTGRNGSGKTTLLKLVWYVISGNIEHALTEVDFNKVTVWTDQYRVSVVKISNNTCTAEFEINGKLREIQDRYDHDNDIISDARTELKEIIVEYGRTMFFPTFRRIEGGFTTGQTKSSANALFNASRQKNDLQEAVLAISKRLSNGGHTFVTSISTVDIVELLLRTYTEMSEEANALQRTTSQDVIDRIKAYRREAGEGRVELVGPNNPESVLDNIRSMIEEMETQRVAKMAPFEAVQSLGTKLFQHSGIKLGARLNFGDAANAINSDSLSAGEKQMLSFICYNAFTDNSVIFIDEPELSLHVDWQRTLFPTLMGQERSNQYIIATHSPFIYSKYPEKEIMLSDSRGHSEEDTVK